eukprot:m.386978 g.386978  ORF g.386978 m.386978 type:complete len:53 (-) comp159479_c0_seq1:26-184(-)
MKSNHEVPNTSMYSHIQAYNRATVTNALSYMRLAPCYESTSWYVLNFFAVLL